MEENQNRQYSEKSGEAGKYPFISVIVPTHNRKELLKDTLRSLCQQTYPKERFEVIIIDNVSSDNTEELFKDTSLYLPCKVSYWRNERDLGPAGSRNSGVKKSEGEWLAFTDSDCLADKDWLKNAAEKFNGKIALVQGKTVPNPEQPVKVYSRTISVSKENGFYETCNIFYRRDVFLSVGGFSEEYGDLRDFTGYPMGGEDLDLAWRIKRLGHGSIFADNAVIYHHVFDCGRNSLGFVGILKLITAEYKIFHLVIIPYMVKKFPELRRASLFARVFLSKLRFWYGILLLAVIFGVIFNPMFFLAGIPYLYIRTNHVFSGRPLTKTPNGVLLVLFCLVRDTIIFFILLSASVRYRSLVI